jgi:23S rRNA (cytidine2498-2'-O)-methyltransferase
MSGFFFCAVNIGSERALKGELVRLRPEARPAFGRPGLVTFKTPVPPAADFALEAVFARAHGLSIGPAADVEAVWAAARAVGATRLHLWDRAGGPVRDDAPFREGGLFAPGSVAVPGEVVLDVACGPSEMFVGHHVHRAGRSPWPGGFIPVALPPEAPSRAFAKLEEAIAWSGASPRRGEVALDIGSAPGGASYALLRRGLTVVGVDPGEMDPVVVGHPEFRHLRVAVGALRREDLPAGVSWLLVDVNLAPQVALHSIRRIVPMIRTSLRGAILTLKLNETRFAAEIPAFLTRVRELGLGEVRATQLPSNRQEICVVGLR